MEFKDFPLGETLLASLERLGFTEPTPIQGQCLGPILQGLDVMALAETGSGKTGAFAIPLIEGLTGQEEGATYVVLSPTRELAQQTHGVFKDLATGVVDLRTACLIGGDATTPQERALGDNPSVVVATPGRMIDFIQQKKLDLSGARTIVFDEVDRLFDMGFKKDIEFILSVMPPERQILMFSATGNQDVRETAYRHGANPLEIKLNEDDLTAKNIHHVLAMVGTHEKMSFLVNELRKDGGIYALVFCNTQFQTHLVAHWLRLMNIKARPISGRLTQPVRTELMEDFKARKISVLVCTDVAARGLHIEAVDLVVNYDLPREPENYVHRIGRTGRGEHSGRAIALCAHEDCAHLDAIYNLVGPIPKMELGPGDFVRNLCRKPQIDPKTLLPSGRGETTRERSMNRPAPSKEKRTPMVPFVHSEMPGGDTRIFQYTHVSEEEARRAALGYFQINDASIVQGEILKRGRKRFFFFGPSQKTFKFTLKPIYKKLLGPFVTDVLRLSRLRVQASVGLKNRVVKINFKGPDTGFLRRNSGEYLDALASVVKIYCAKRIFLPKNVHFHLECEGKAEADISPREEEEELRARVDSLKEEIRASGKPGVLKFLNPTQRRLIHQYIGEGDEFETRSLGDGHYKRVEIDLKPS